MLWQRLQNLMLRLRLWVSSSVFVMWSWELSGGCAGVLQVLKS